MKYQKAQKILILLLSVISFLLLASVLHLQERIATIESAHQQNQALGFLDYEDADKDIVSLLENLYSRTGLIEKVLQQSHTSYAASFYIVGDVDWIAFLSSADCYTEYLDAVNPPPTGEQYPYGSFNFGSVYPLVDTVTEDYYVVHQIEVSASAFLDTHRCWVKFPTLNLIELEKE